MEWTIVRKISQGSFGIVSEIRTKSGECFEKKIFFFYIFFLKYFSSLCIERSYR